MKIVVLTGAGISAESGIKTFRDADGLWEGHDVMEVASPEGFANNPDLVYDFYNQRRRQLMEVKPNAAHFDLVKLEEKHEVVIITQNVDDLHERAGSSNILHLHGQLLKVRSMQDRSLVYDWTKDLTASDKNDAGHQLRPHIVWFGEDVPMISKAAQELTTAEVVMIVGTSMQVYPAASLVGYAPKFAKVFYVDPRPASSHLLDIRGDNAQVIAKVASLGVKEVVDSLLG